MSLYQISLLCICSVFLLLLLKQYDASYGLLFALLVCMVLMQYACNYLAFVFDKLRLLENKVEGGGAFVGLLLKAIGSTYVTSLASNLCKDAGYGSLALQMEMVGKGYLLFLSMPVVNALLSVLETL